MKYLENKNIENAEIKEKSFDTITRNEVIHGVKNEAPFKYFEEISKILLTFLQKEL